MEKISKNIKDIPLEDHFMVKEVIEKLGTKFGLKHQITEQKDTVTISFFTKDNGKPYGEVVLKKKNMELIKNGK
ncbi:MAG: hypothetical protein AABY22_11890 [Nanoarchaeota archaeon]